MVTQTTESQQQAAERIAETVLEVYNTGNVELLEDITAPDFVAYHYAVPDPIRGVEAYKKRVIDLRNGFSDFEIKQDLMIVEGDSAAGVYTWTGTHDGPYGGLEATGKKVDITSATISKMRDGKLTEFHVFGDRLKLLEQVGEPPSM